MPWRIQSDRDRSAVAAVVGGFKGGIRVPADLSADGMESLRRGIAGRLASEHDPARDVWIAAGRIETPSSLFSLLHARIDGPEAAVDLLLSLERPDPAKAYDGYGELLLLSTVLEKSGVRRLSIPIGVDPKRSGLEAAGWKAGPDGVWIRAGAA